MTTREYNKELAIQFELMKKIKHAIDLGYSTLTLSEELDASVKKCKEYDEENRVRED